MTNLCYHFSQIVQIIDRLGDILFQIVEFYKLNISRFLIVTGSFGIWFDIAKRMN